MVLINETWKYDNLRDALIKETHGDITPWISTIDSTLKMDIYQRMYLYITLK